METKLRPRKSPAGTASSFLFPRWPKWPKWSENSSNLFEARQHVVKTHQETVGSPPVEPGERAQRSLEEGLTMGTAERSLTDNNKRFGQQSRALLSRLLATDEIKGLSERPTFVYQQPKGHQPVHGKVKSLKREKHLERQGRRLETGWALLCSLVNDRRAYNST